MSIHLLEEFEAQELKGVLLGWLRILVIDGNLVFYLPDEQKYRKRCRNTGQDYNHSHKIENFSLDYIKSLLSKTPNIEIIHEKAACEDYSFEIVLRKTGPTERMNLVREEKEEEIEQLKRSLVDKDNRIRDLEQTIFRMRKTKGWRMLEKLRKARTRFLAFQR
jgi:predicted SAM-dependent methyltransferase